METRWASLPRLCLPRSPSQEHVSGILKVETDAPTGKGDDVVMQLGGGRAGTGFPSGQASILPSLPREAWRKGWLLG